NGKGRQRRVAARRNKQERRYHLPVPRQCVAVLRCPPAFAANRGKPPLVRTVPSPPLPPCALPDSCSDRDAALPKTTAHRERLLHSVRRSSVRLRRAPDTS